MYLQYIYTVYAAVSIYKYTENELKRLHENKFIVESYW